MITENLATKQDFSSSISLFLVSLPLSAGIAVASKADPQLGILTALFGALIFGLFSSTPLAVFGPSAGLSIFLSMASIQFGDFKLLSPAIFLCGVWLFVLSFFNAHRLVSIVPRSVSRGMATGIGLILMLKMIPHFFGIDETAINIEGFEQSDGRNTFTEIAYSLGHILPGALWVTLGTFVSALLFRKTQYMTLVAVATGVSIQLYFSRYLPELALNEQHRLVIDGINLHFKGLQNFTDNLPKILELSLILTSVILIEGMITLDLFQRIDPGHNQVQPRRELKLLGAVNMLMGVIGALPLMPVLVRSTANVQFGARTRFSVFYLGIWLMLSLLFYDVLKFIPMASIAVVLFIVGLRLIDLKEIKRVFSDGWVRGLPFIITVAMMLFVDLLWGIIGGFVVGLILSLRSAIKRTMVLVNDEERYLLKFYKDVTFLNKVELREQLTKVPRGNHVVIDGTGNVYIDPEIELWLEDYAEDTLSLGGKVTFLKSRLAISKLFKE